MKFSKVETKKCRFQKFHFITAVASLTIIPSQRRERKCIKSTPLDMHMPLYRLQSKKTKKNLGHSESVLPKLHASRLAAYMKTARS